METAKENGLNVNRYLTWLLEQLPTIDLQDKEALDTLLPWSPQVPANCKLKQ
ncbi:transposase domain-containing protein [Sporomusa carbonis]|uniref:transposase domain-containing protein n=1 Tax=Sporomusa carbonis TaxID=3076075 RepID=UPI003C7C23E9